MAQDDSASVSSNRDATMLGVRALNAIQQTLAAVFPQFMSTSTTATGGAATLPANPVGFFTVTNPDTGATVKIPYYAE